MRSALIVSGLVLLLAAPAAAQRRGGSFGGRSSSWGRSSGSSSSGSSFGRSSSSGSSFGSSGSSGSSFGSSRSSGSSFGSSRSSGSSFGSSRSSGSSLGSSGSSGSSYGQPSGPPPVRWTERGQPETTAAERAALRPRASPPPAFPTKYRIGALFLGLFALSWLVPWAVKRFDRAPRLGPAPRFDVPVSRTPIWLRRLSLGYDWTVREALQEQLDALAQRLSFASDRDRAHAAREVLALLRAHNDGLRYGLADVEALDDRTGPPRLDRLALDLRSRFTHETRGARAGAAPDEALAPRADEGAGMIVVSIVVASFDAIPDVELLDRPSSFVALSADFGDAVPALEVIWSPSEPDDRMSSHELEKFYPELRRLNDAGDVGSMTCPHCGAPRPAELDFCPRCGSETRR